VWNSGILLTRLLVKMNLMSNSSLFKDKTTIELGCGAALSSIAVGKLVGAVGGGGGATSSVVIATDNNPEVLLLAKRNIERNNLSSVVRTAMLQWGSMAAMDYENCADIVIGSDLTYNSGSWLALAETMSTILKPEGIVVYLVSFDSF
jgi:predicted nicotinamide N-methyase